MLQNRVNISAGKQRQPEAEVGVKAECIWTY